MDLTLLSGVVRNRKVMASAVSRSQALFDEGQGDAQVPHNTIDKLRSYFTKNSIFKKFSLRVHKFTFQWELAIHLLVCILSLTPFFFTGRRLFSLIPISVWLFYNVLFLIGPQHSNKLIPRFGRIKNSFKTNIEEFFSPKLLPVLSISFLCVVLSLAVTGHRLGGPPLCYHPCGVCLATWKHSVPLSAAAAAIFARVDPLVHPLVSPLDSPYDPLLGRVDPLVDAYRVGCGFANGKELLGYYTMAQTSFLLFIVVVVAITVCLAWRVADEEKSERRSAEEWLKRDAKNAFEMRQQLIDRFGSPGSSVRPEGSAVWVYFGVTAALTFTLLGWHNWYVLPPSNTATLLIILNLLTILMSTLILHLSFFGRLLALYKRNFFRVECLTQLLSKTEKDEIDSWWNCRNFVLNDDLSLDYDIGGLAVSATFLIALVLFAALLTQLAREGLQGMLEPPGSYLAYACLYITCCLIKLFTLATNTYEEQHRHIAVLQSISNSMQTQGAMSTDYNEYLEYKGGIGGPARSHQEAPWLKNSSEDEFLGMADDGPLLIDDEESDNAQPASPLRLTPPGTPDRLALKRDTSNNAHSLSLIGGGSGSNVGSPRKPRGKTSATMQSLVTNSVTNLSYSEDSPGSPVERKTLNNNHATHGSGLMNNWLGKTIFGSFKVNSDEEQSLLHNNNTAKNKTHTVASGSKGTSTTAADVLSLDISVVEQGGTFSSGSGNNSPTLPTTQNNNTSHNPIKQTNSQVKLHGISTALPRPHNNNNNINNNHSHHTTTSKLLHVDIDHDKNDTGIVKLSPFNGAVTPFSPLLPIGFNASSPSVNSDFNASSLGPSLVHSIDTSANPHSSHNNTHNTTASTTANMPAKPVLTRSVSHNATMESYRQTIAEIISQIRIYDPYPCILGIPVMPALFNSSKFYIFIVFTLLGIRTMTACLRQL